MQSPQAKRDLPVNALAGEVTAREHFVGGRVSTKYLLTIILLFEPDAPS